MKKLLVAAVAVFALSFVSCGNATNKDAEDTLVCDSDSCVAECCVEEDTTAVDTTVVDSIVEEVVEEVAE